MREEPTLTPVRRKCRRVQPDEKSSASKTTCCKRSVKIFGVQDTSLPWKKPGHTHCSDLRSKLAGFTGISFIRWRGRIHQFESKEKITHPHALFSLAGTLQQAYPSPARLVSREGYESGPDGAPVGAREYRPDRGRLRQHPLREVRQRLEAQGRPPLLLALPRPDPDGAAIDPQTEPHRQPLPPLGLVLALLVLTAAGRAGPRGISSGAAATLPVRHKITSPEESHRRGGNRKEHRRTPRRGKRAGQERQERLLRHKRAASVPKGSARPSTQQKNLVCVYEATACVFHGVVQRS